MALDATISGAAANSYVTVAAASTYFTARLDAAAWTDATTAEREAALIMATQRLDLESYYGSPTSTTQLLQWPRWGVSDRVWGDFASDAMPAPLQQATFEYALALLKDPSLTGADMASLSQFSLGTLSVTLRPSSSTALPPVVRALIAPLRIGGMVSVHVVRA